MSERREINTDSAPEAVGPYSQAIAHDGVLHCSGQVPLDPATGELVEGSIGEQAARCLENLSAVCLAAGTALERALKVTIYTTDLDRFAEINEAYERFFDAAPPSRVTVGAAALPLGAEIEIAATVAL